jgi:hypothetical protein
MSEEYGGGGIGSRSKAGVYGGYLGVWFPPQKVSVGASIGEVEPVE